ncbi:MAG: TIM barrel protein [Candidatus Aenigmarchaeota archaeon]|nr:TIM barrel protein [Candidatus Aenigmarchaeota archaeon]
MIKPQKLNFGTAGIPLSTPKPSTPNGILRVKELGLDAMEMEFVRGVRMSDQLAEESRQIAINSNIILTAHGPYYINLNSAEKPIIHASIERILQTARTGYKAGAYSITFHPAFYGKTTKEDTYKTVRKAVEKIVATLKDEGIKIWVRPETMGKPSQFGTLEEIISLSQQIDMIMPCIDFSHMHAREGKMNTEDEFRSIFENMEKDLGKESLKNLHCHLQGIEYGEKGEKRHRILEDSDMNYKTLLKIIKEFNCRGVIICESPNIEQDAILLKNTYKQI